MMILIKRDVLDMVRSKKMRELFKITDKERKVIMLHLQEEKSFAEISLDYRVSRQRIQQVYERALRKLRRNMLKIVWAQAGLGIPNVFGVGEG